MNNKTNPIPRPTLQRIVMYLNYLRALPESVENTSATTIAQELKLNPVLVRKDLAFVSCSGKPKVGYTVRQLTGEIELFLGYDDVRSAVVAGAGNLGRALLASDAFENHGFQIVAAFDTHPDEEWSRRNRKPIYPMDDLVSFCRRAKVNIGIITAPPAAAQQVCDLFVEAGIRAIWNFTSINLAVPPHILVKNEDLTVSLALLSNLLIDQLSPRRGSENEPAPLAVE